SWRITRPARLFHGGNFYTGDFFASRNDLPHRVAIAVAEIVEALLARRETEDVRLREVQDVDVVTDASAVGCRVIRAVNLDARRLAERHFEDIRDEVRLQAMMLAEFLA